mgnify:FL=1
MDKDNIYVLRDIDCFMSVTEAIREQGLTLENRIIEKKVIESNYYLSKQLNVPLATKLFYLCRVRYVEGIAQSIEKHMLNIRRWKDLKNMILGIHRFMAFY